MTLKLDTSESRSEIPESALGEKDGDDQLDPSWGK